MTQTVTAAFIPTETYSGMPDNIVNFAESVWNSDVRTGGAYELHAYALECHGRVSLDGPDDFDDAWSQVLDSSVVQSYLSFYDAVVVVDGREDLDGPRGRARHTTAGGSNAIGYSKGDYQDTALHELGHIFGARHRATSTEAHWTNLTLVSHCIMNGPHNVTCDGSRKRLYRGSAFSDCAVKRMREFIDEEM